MTEKTGLGGAPIDQASQTISLLTTTTGLIDIYALSVQGEPDWIVPQNIVLDTLNVSAKSNSVVWQGQTIPLFSLLGEVIESPEAVAVVLEGDNDATRLAVLTAIPPKPMRVRISNLRDVTAEQPLAYAYQPVLLADELYQVPDLQKALKSVAS